MQKGTLYGVSVGPGDPELLTLKAVRVLKQCPVIAAPETSGGSLALEIAAQGVPLGEKTILKLPFPMSRSEEITRENHRVQAKRLAEYLSKGQSVAMLNLGDVSVYSTFSYLMALLQKEFPVEMVPGVPSFCAVAATLQTSLTEKTKPLHIIPSGYGTAAEYLKLPGTKVLMKPHREFPALLQALREEGLLEKAAMVQNCGLPEEKIVRDCGAEIAVEDASYFTTVLVK